MNDLTDDLFSRYRYPEAPGHQVTDTSRAAAVALLTEAGSIRHRVLCILNNRDCTADECALLMDMSILSVRPRLTELKRMGRIADSGVRRPNESGKQAIVWRFRP